MLIDAATVLLVSPKVSVVPEIFHGCVSLVITDAIGPVATPSATVVLPSVIVDVKSSAVRSATKVTVALSIAPAVFIASTKLGISEEDGPKPTKLATSLSTFYIFSDKML